MRNFIYKKILIAKNRIKLLRRAAAIINGSPQVVEFRNCFIFCKNDSKLEKVLIYESENYDSSNFGILEYILKPGETFLDIGANIGIYSLVASKLVGRDGRVIAFEPVENIHNKLTLNKLLNDCDNLELRKTAIGSHIGQAEIYAVKQGIFRQGTSSLVVNENLTAMGLDKFEIQKIDVQSLDYLLSRNLLAAVDFIKIDVEGHEIEVLNGGLELLSKYHPVLLLEHSLPRLEKLGISESRFADFFDSLGYLAFQVNLKHNKLILTPYSFNGKFERNNLFLIHSDNIGKISSIIAS